MAMTPISPREAVRLGATSLTLYGRLFFPKTFRQSSPAFHDEIGKVLMATSPDYRNVAIEVFRDGAKTTLLRTYASQRIAYGISRTILIVSASQAHSIYSVRWLKKQVEKNTAWAETFGLTKGSKWTDEFIEIQHAKIDSTITVIALGITGQVRGINLDDYRPDLIICDDTSTDEASSSVEQRAKQTNLVFGALLNSLAPVSECPSAKAVILDTPKTKFDLIESCEKDGDWKFFRFGILDEKNESRWPERYPTAEILRKKASETRAGRTHIWMREKECKLISLETSSFNEANLCYWDEIPKGAFYFIAIDPASSDSPEADDNCTMVIAFFGRKVYVVEYIAETGQDPEMVGMAVLLYARKYPISGIIVESVSYQKILAWYLERFLRDRRIYLPIHKFDDRRRKADRIIQALGDTSAMSRLYCLATQSKFIAQYIEFSPSVKMHDDVIDCLAIGVCWSMGVMIEDWIEGEYKEVSDDDEDGPRHRRLSNFRSAP